MILAIPYNPTLPGGYDKLASALIRHGRNPNHSLFVVSTEEHEEGAFAFAMKVRTQFGRHFSITIPNQPESMLGASNRIFLAALDALRSYEPTEDEMQEPVMLYFDPTWKITVPQWLNAFQAEYYLKGAPLTFGYFRVKGEKSRVDGPVAISRGFLKISKLLPFLSDKTHWREFLAWEMTNNGLQSEAFGRNAPAYLRPANS